MCGRFSLASPPSRLARFFEAEVEDGLEERFRPSYNLPPTRQVLGVTEEAGHRLLGSFGWGLLPSWASDARFAARTFNARAETVATKPAFRAAFRARRCLVPADPGFFEWSKRPGEGRVPYLFRRSDGETMAFAGLFERWRPGPQAPWRRTLTIITTAAGDDVAPVHDRQPVVLERNAWERWLDPSHADRDELEALLVASPAGTLWRHRVPTRVGRPENDDPGVIEEPPGAAPVAGDPVAGAPS